MRMTAAAKQPTGATALGNGSASVVVIASDDGMRRRVVETLTAQDLAPATEARAPADLAERDVDGSTIAVFVCDIDAPHEMAELRRLGRDPRRPAIVAISPPATGTGLRRALDAGVDGLVFGPELDRALGTTVRAVAAGQSVVPRELRASVETPVLSHRERQVLTLVRSGLTNAQIAERLFLAESTIKSHLSSVFTKFGVRSRKEAAAVYASLEPAWHGAEPVMDEPATDRALA
jgi:DNA-binding NarL/FixJ family response regulator